MTPHQKELLNLKILPARLTVEQGAYLLGFQAPDLPILCARGLLKPLGRPPPTGSKFFSTAALMRLAEDDKWLERASDAIVQHWRRKNASRKQLRKGASAGETERTRNVPFSSVSAAGSPDHT